MKWISFTRRNDQISGRTGTHRSTEINVGRLSFHTLDWSISWTTERTPVRTSQKVLIAIRCSCCWRFSLGCSEHWFCGVCEACRCQVLDELTEEE